MDNTKEESSQHQEHVPTRHAALRQALAPTEPRRLPSNFAYKTLQRIQRESERRQRIAAIVTIAVVSLIGLTVLGYLFGQALLSALVTAYNETGTFALVFPTLFCLVFFALLNHWLARHYCCYKDS